MKFLLFHEGPIVSLIYLLHDTCTRTEPLCIKRALTWSLSVTSCWWHTCVSVCAQPIGTGSGLIIISLWRQPFQETQVGTFLLGRSSGECRQQCSKICSPQHLLLEPNLEMGKTCLSVTAFCSLRWPILKQATTASSKSKPVNSETYIPVLGINKK